jgi:hypothetical protein
MVERNIGGMDAGDARPVHTPVLHRDALASDSPARHNDRGMPRYLIPPTRALEEMMAEDAEQIIAEG